MPDSVDPRPVPQVLAERLVAAGKLSESGLERALRVERESRERLEAILTRLGLVSERDLADMLAEILALPIVAAKDFPEAPLLDDALSRKFLKEARVLPIRDGAEGVVLAMADPLDDFSAEAVRLAASYRPRRSML